MNNPGDVTAHQNGAELRDPAPLHVTIPHASDFIFGGGVVLACAQNSDVRPDEDHGLFAGDTRVLSKLLLTIDGKPFELLGRARPDNGIASWEFQNPEIPGKLTEGALLVSVTRHVNRALHQHLRLRYFVSKPVTVRLAIELDADFADIFEVKDGGPRPRTVRRELTDAGLLLHYDRERFRRALHVEVTADTPAAYCDRHINFDLDLHRGLDWSLCLMASPVLEQEACAFPFDPHAPDEQPAKHEAATRMSGDSMLALAFERGRRDLQALAIEHPHGPPFLGAGVPQFLTVFGRDALMSGLISAIATPWANEGALAVVGELQATEHDTWRDAEPGKLPHELRRGEKAFFREIPHTPYYGAHDVPALYCLALWQAWRWSGDKGLLERHLPTAVRALRWCDEFGDRDGDGLQEYGTRSRDGYYNQSWKDAEDAILTPAGEKAALPLATVELQGYLFAARLALAELHDVVGDHGEAQRLRDAAEALRLLVEERFWIPEEQFYAVAIDGDKRQVRSLTCNPGHLLWTGLAAPDRALAVAGRFMTPEFSSGWGLRTLSSQHVGYNPIDYQRGAVWPHDTMLNVAGMLRYGAREAAMQLMHGVLSAASHFEQYRLPELFSGLESSNGFPIPYGGANVPQAWGASTPILAAQLLLGLVPDAPSGRCFISPALPTWLPRLELHNVKVGMGHFNVVLTRDGEATHVERLDADGIEVVTETVEAPLWGLPMTRSMGARGEAA